MPASTNHPRRQFLRVLAIGFAVWALPAERCTAVDVPDLKQELEAGLKARRRQEFTFIARVVELVEDDRLPVSLVKGTFHWARKKARKNGYPYQYFERGIRIHAARLKVNL